MLRGDEDERAPAARELLRAPARRPTPPRSASPVAAGGRLACDGRRSRSARESRSTGSSASSRAGSPYPRARPVDALAGALRLDESDREHLLRLALGALSGARKPWKRETVPAHLSALVRDQGGSAYVTGARCDLLVWNDAAVELFRDFAKVPVAERNTLLQLFVSPEGARATRDGRTRARGAPRELPNHLRSAGRMRRSSRPSPTSSSGRSGVRAPGGEHTRSGPEAVGNQDDEPSAARPGPDGVLHVPGERRSGPPARPLRKTDASPLKVGRT